MKRILLLALISLSCQIDQNSKIETFDQLGFIKPNLNSIITLIEMDSIKIESILLQNGYTQFSTENDLISFGKNMFEKKFQTITYSLPKGYLHIYWSNSSDTTNISSFIKPELKKITKSQNETEYYTISRNHINYTIALKEYKGENQIESTTMDFSGKILSVENYDVIEEELIISSDEYILKNKKTDANIMYENK